MHQCVRCKSEYSDTDPRVLSGCTCGGRLFFFIRDDQDVRTADNIIQKLSPGDIDAFETSISCMDTERRRKVDAIIRKAASKEESVPKKEPVPKVSKERKPRKSKQSFGIETVKSVRPGIYEINIKGLLEGQPVIVLSKGGSYIIHLPSAFGTGKK